MANGRFSSEIVSGWMDGIYAKDLYLALFFTDPQTVSDPLSVEVVGGVYSRQLGVWTRSAPNVLTLSEAVVFPGLPPGTSLVAVGVFDAAFNGTFIASDLIPAPDSPVSYPSGGTYVLPAGQYILGIDVSGN